MGTRSITVIRDDENRKIVEIYQQLDGYPSSMGERIKKFIKSGKIVNGISVGEKNTVFNGIECFAAQFIVEFKKEPGGLYLFPPTEDHTDKTEFYKSYNAEYYYEIDSFLNVRCWDTSNGEEVIL